MARLLHCFLLAPGMVLALWTDLRRGVDTIDGLLRSRASLINTTVAILGGNQSLGLGLAHAVLRTLLRRILQSFGFSRLGQAGGGVGEQREIVGSVSRRRVVFCSTGSHGGRGIGV